MAPSVAWGIGVGSIIAVIDTVALVLTSTDGSRQGLISDVDFLANVMLYSLIGFRVGRITGVVREAAEAGVIAAVLVAAIALAANLVLRPATGTIDSTQEVIAIVAQNIAIGGVLAILAGWIGSRARSDRPTSHR